MKDRRLLVLGIMVAFAALGFWFGATSPTRERPTPAPLASAMSVIPQEDVSPTAPAPLSAPADPVPKSPLLMRIEELLASLQQGEPSHAAIEQLKRELLGGDPAESIAAILDFLARGEDASTGQDFAIGKAGSELAQAPTLRVMLMDVLGQLARATKDPAAATFARAVLAEKTSADEWAISLRNVAWHEPQAKPFLAGKIREMLAWQPWRAQPSGGMIEAFDVIVFTRDASFIPTLAELQSQPDTPLNQAATVALDRLAEAAPLEVINYLNSNPATLADRPLLRADYFAKADLSQPAERQALEVHLSRPEVTLAEKTKLLKALATPASFVSDNLLTPPIPAGNDEIRQTVLSKTVGDWVKTNRFPELSGPLSMLQQRLGMR